MFMDKEENKQIHSYTVYQKKIQKQLGKNSKLNFKNNQTKPNTN